MLVLFFGGILVGIDKASEGIIETRGYSVSDDDAIGSQVDENGKAEVNVMGENLQQINLENKQEEYQEVQSTHLTQKVAGNLERGVKWFYNQLIHTAYQLVQAFF